MGKETQNGNGRAKAQDIFGSEMVSDIVESKINGYVSFFIAPDGSKEGWDASDLGDSRRKEFIDWSKNVDIEGEKDGDTYFKYAEVMYGDDNGEAEIVNHN